MASNKPQRAVALLASLLLAGCTVGPDFAPPKPDTPAGWTEDALHPVGKSEQQRSTSTAPIESRWWSSFDDPTFTSLIARATAANLDLRQAALRIAEARAEHDVTAAGLYPSLSGNAGYTRERISEETAFTSLLGSIGGPHTPGSAPAGGVSGAIPSLPNPFDQYQWGFDASWEIDLFGRVRRSVEAANATTKATVEDRNDLLVSLQGDVARYYIDLRAAQLRSSVLEDDLTSQREILDLTRDRARAGIGNDVDVANAAAEVTSTEAQVPQATAQISADINQLSLLLALPPGALHGELETAKPVPPIPPAVPVGLPADLARRRPDIRRAEAQLHAATAQVGVAVADLFPRLTLNADLGVQAERFADLSNWAGRFFSLGPSLEIPIFSGGARRATVALDDEKAEEAALTYASTVLSALHDVENALTAYGTEQSRHSALAATLAQNRTALDLAQQRYESGVAGFLDVLYAERTLQQTELLLTDSTAMQSTDLVALYKALGGGWQTEPGAAENSPSGATPKTD
ncbi:MAG TPA: efflux transporter outer membrane subunit [Stellaceae bacterium]|jgi:NodT family efflux transporter outer membrane factor (OMF) lipoprotein